MFFFQSESELEVGAEGMDALASVEATGLAGAAGVERPSLDAALHADMASAVEAMAAINDLFTIAPARKVVI
jgi:hypothetical protein